VDGLKLKPSKPSTVDGLKAQMTVGQRKSPRRKPEEVNPSALN
jgi:hypothetical protein